MLTWTTLSLIDGYQRHISPRKGFCCAYRMRHGGPGCSGFAKQAIAEHGVLSALAPIRRRFADCKAAALALSSHQENDPRSQREKRNQKRNLRRGCWVDVCMGCDPGLCARAPWAQRGDGEAAGLCDQTPDCTPSCDALPNCTPSCDCLPCSCGS